MNEQNKLRPLEALSILEQASGLAPLPRAEHQRVIDALKVIQEAIKPEEKKK